MANSYDCYIGFAVKKGAVVYGIDNIEVYRKKMFLILCSYQLASNSLSKARTVATDKRIPLKVIKGMEDLLKKNCKVLGICDKNLSDAIVSKIENQV